MALAGLEHSLAAVITATPPLVATTAATHRPSQDPSPEPPRQDTAALIAPTKACLPTASSGVRLIQNGCAFRPAQVPSSAIIASLLCSFSTGRPSSLPGCISRVRSSLTSIVCTLPSINSHSSAPLPYHPRCAQNPTTMGMIKNSTPKKIDGAATQKKAGIPISMPVLTLHTLVRLVREVQSARILVLLGRVTCRLVSIVLCQIRLSSS